MHDGRLRTQSQPDRTGTDGKLVVICVTLKNDTEIG